jgi:hypothetical protein
MAGRASSVKHNVWANGRAVDGLCSPGAMSFMMETFSHLQRWTASG